MAVIWVQTKFPGVRYREHATRKHGIRKDRCFTIRFKQKGKEREEVVGWSSEGVTEESAYAQLAELKQNARTGAGPTSLAEKREFERLEREKKLRQAAHEERTALNLSAYWKQYYAPHAKLEKAAETWRREESMYKTWLLPFLDKFPMRELTPHDFDKILVKMREQGRAPRSIQLVFATMRAVWNHAFERGFVQQECPVHSVKIGRINNARTRILSPEEATALLETIRRLDNNAWEFTLACLHTGGRLGEVARLTWGNIDMAKGFLTLMHTKSGKPRSIPLTKTLKLVLDNKIKGKLDELVFTNANGDQWRSMPANFRKAIKQQALNEGRNDRRDLLVFHSLRHSAASMLLEAGEHIRTIQEIFGWSTLAMAQRYLHPTDEGKVRALKNLETVLTNPTN